MWKRGLRGGKMQLAGAALDKSLFLFNPPLRNALLTVRQLSAPLSSLGMLSLPPRETFDVDDFIKAQNEGECAVIKCGYSSISALLARYILF